MGEWESRIHFARYMLMLGPIIGATCAILSVYVVLRGMALISEGVSHAGFGGVSLAVLIGYFVPSMDSGTSGAIWREIITGLFCLGTALAMGYVTRKKRVSEDSAIGIFLVATVAIGMLLIKVRQTLPPNGRPMPVDLEHLLFGDFTNVNATDALIAGTGLFLVVAIVSSLYYQFLYTTLDEEMARINGVNTKLINTLLLMMISLVIVVCVRMVGFLMITALTIIPGATANMLSRKFIGVMIAAILVGTLGTFAAVCLCIVPPISNYPPGSLIVLTLFAIFGVVWAIKHFIKPTVSETGGGAITTEHDHNLVQSGPSGSAFGHGHSH